MATGACSPGRPTASDGPPRGRRERRAACGVVEAAAGTEGLRHAWRDGPSRTPPCPTDLRPPVLDGHAASPALASDPPTEARQLRPGLKILFTAGRARGAAVHRGPLDLGVRPVTKPFACAEPAPEPRDLLAAPPAS